MSGVVGTLTRALSCTGSDEERYTVPAGYVVTVHRLAGERCAVVLDGRVYRAASAAVRVSR